MPRSSQLDAQYFLDEFMDSLTQLAIDWQLAWQNYFCNRSPQTYQQNQINPVFELLVDAYTQPDRYYHNLDHINHLLTILERFNQGKLRDPLAVFLAIWFHDFVYDSQATGNETQSAKAAHKLLTNLGASIDLIVRVEQLILATQGHQISPKDFDQSVFLDADLAILGADPLRYQAYAQSIRREYSWVPELDYKAGRIGILKSFLKRPRLYCTDLLFGELEAIARHNLAQEIDSLQIS
jgi:predicted metal-dependent HD superfamily phosphohydrolase